MKLLLFKFFMVIGALQSVPAFAQTPDFGEILPPDVPVTTKQYGADQAQKIWYSSGHNRATPLIVFLDQRDWAGSSEALANLRNSLFQKGFAVASVGYRSPCEVGIDGVIADIGAALKFLMSDKSRTKFDANRIVVLGNGSGAAFAALIGADPLLISKFGIPFSSIRSVVLLDGDGMDAPKELGRAEGARAVSLQTIFGLDRDTQRDRSAIGQITAPNAPSYYLLTDSHLSGRISAMHDFASALRQSGTNVIEDTMINSKNSIASDTFGFESHRATKALLKYIETAVK